MIGWVLLSRTAVAKAEQALKSEQQGIVDEVGLLALHQGFSDRFFPGTSVLHTRLRYVLFVPWLMEESQGDGRKLASGELTLTQQLLAGKRESPQDDFRGIIGGDVWPREASQLPSMSYWSAIVRWGILRPDTPVRVRSDALRTLSSSARHHSGRIQHVDGEPLTDADHSPFVQLPDPPEVWLKKGKPLAFALSTDERKFLRRHLLGVKRDPKASPLSLLAKMAEMNQTELRALVDASGRPWSPAISNVADDEDRKALKLARHASDLACIGRAIYTALAEAAKEKDGAGACTIHRWHLKAMVAEYGERAKQVDLGALRSTIPGLPDDLIDVLKQTVGWLESGKSSINSLHEVYEHAEVRRKQSRARLSRLKSGRSRRAEWNVEDHPLAKPLHYRWPNVRALLRDLSS